MTIVCVILIYIGVCVVCAGILIAAIIYKAPPHLNHDNDLTPEEIGHGN